MSNNPFTGVLLDELRGVDYRQAEERWAAVKAKIRPLLEFELTLAEWFALHPPKPMLEGEVRVLYPLALHVAVTMGYGLQPLPALALVNVHGKIQRQTFNYYA